MKVVLLSDTHLNYLPMPDGDMLIHAGDIACMGTLSEVARAVCWLASLPHPYKVLVAGTHDGIFEKAPDAARRLVEERGIVYLQDQFIILENLRIWGSPWQPEFNNWAFNLPRGRALAEKWAMIPEGLDILVTHGPPAGVLDVNSDNERCGCENLFHRVRQVKPRIHVFGHIHPSHGISQVWGTTFINATVCDDPGNRLRWPATVIDI